MSSRRRAVGLRQSVCCPGTGISADACLRPGQRSHGVSGLPGKTAKEPASSGGRSLSDVGSDVRRSVAFKTGCLWYCIRWTEGDGSELPSLFSAPVRSRICVLFCLFSVGGSRKGETAQKLQGGNRSRLQRETDTGKGIFRHRQPAVRSDFPPPGQRNMGGSPERTV